MCSTLLQKGPTSFVFNHLLRMTVQDYLHTYLHSGLKNGKSFPNLELLGQLKIVPLRHEDQGSETKHMRQLVALFSKLCTLCATQNRERRDFECFK